MFASGPGRARPCQFEYCGVRAWRRCRVCSLSVCRDHRFGSAHWFRCLSCPAAALREARRLWEEQAQEERRAELDAQLLNPPPPPDAVISTYRMTPHSPLVPAFLERWPHLVRYRW